MKWLIDGMVIDLPEFRRIKLVCGVDRYGFSSLLADQLGTSWTRRSFANWQHGWIWWGASSSEDLMMFDAQKNQSFVIVSKHTESEVLRSEGYKNIWVGGLPFAYTSKSRWGKAKGSLLAMPPHNSEQGLKGTINKFTKLLTEYLDYLESLKKNFSSIWVSIYHLDVSPSVIDAIYRRGLFFIEGARPDDRNSLSRVRSILDTFEFVTTNIMGSHVIYALFCGCKVSIIGPNFQVDESDFLLDNRSTGYSKKYLDEYNYYLSKVYLQDKFSFLLTDNPKNGYQSEKYAKEEIGFYNLLTNKEILDALQWRWIDQLKGYSSGGVRRVRRILSSHDVRNR